MNKLNKKKQSGGILSAIAALFKGGAATGGVSGAAATGGIFATKAGILGLLLGGATIAAGAGAVYHFAGGSSANTAYTPELFQNSYMEEQAAIAEAERAQNSDRRASVVNSTIGMFSEQAKRSGLGFGGDSSFNNEEMPENSENAALTDEARGDAANVSGENSGSSVSNTSASSAKGNKLAAKSMSSIGGASTTTSGSGKTVVPRMTSMGGLSGGVNGKFASMKSAGLAEGGKSSRMTASARRSAAKGRAASPRAGGNNRALGQAKFANSMGNKAVYSASTTGARTAAAAAFTGETAGDGSVEVDSMQGAGMGGAGISMVDGLKSNNPNSSRNVKNVPEVSGSENVSPWKGLEKAIFVALAAAGVLYIIGSLLAKMASKAQFDPVTGWARKIALLKAVKMVSMAVIAAGAIALALSAVIMLKHKQTMLGIVYGIAGGFMAYKGYSLMKEAMSGIKDAEASEKSYFDKMEKSRGWEQIQERTKLDPTDEGYLDKNSDNYKAAVENYKADYAKANPMSSSSNASNLNVTKVSSTSSEYTVNADGSETFKTTTVTADVANNAGAATKSAGIDFGEIGNQVGSSTYMKAVEQGISSTQENK